jgi:transposase
MNEQKGLNAEHLVFLDESGVTTGMTRRYGRALHKERVVDSAPLNHKKSTTIVSSVRLDGTTTRITLEGALNGEGFKSYLREHLAPVLRAGDIVIMDNLSSHKVKGVAEIIAGTGAVVKYLPAYSPDLNPIEEMWSKVKAHLRKVKARDSERLDEGIVAAFGTITRQNCVGWFSHAGYVPPG